MSGPRPLRALVKQWRPKALDQSPLNLDQALAQVALAWTAAVGSGVAARSRPFKLQRGTLFVLTASSAWSDELSLLAPRIVEALQHSCPRAGVRQLRFRVAGGRSKLLFDTAARHSAAVRKLPAPLAAHERPGRTAQPARPAAADAGSRDVGETIARLRALQVELDAERDRAGWLTCAQCGCRYRGGDTPETVCARCAEQQRRALEAQVERALMHAPWLRFADLIAHVPHAAREVTDRVRRRLLTRWEYDLQAAERRLRRGSLTTQDRVLGWSYVMLLARLPQSELGPAVVADVLGRDWAAALFDDPHNTKREAAGPSQQKYK